MDLRSRWILGVVVITVLNIVSAQQQQAGERCDRAAGLTGAYGRCVPVGACVPLLNAVQRDLRDFRSMTLRTLRLLQRAHCGFTDIQPLVCCPETQVSQPSRPSVLSVGIPSAPAAPAPAPSPSGEAEAGLTVAVEHPKLRLLPIDSCGYAVFDRIGRAPNQLLISDQLPTVARIVYLSRGMGERVRCGGSLISSRYVLTAAHCVTGLDPGTVLSGVVLGDFDVTTDPDCETSSTLDLPPDWGSCRPRARRLGVEGVVVHPGYRQGERHHDLALLRLDRPANFSGWEVIPSCLPLGTFQFLQLSERTLLTFGWGTNLRGRVSSPVMRRGSLRSVSGSMCGYAHPGLASAGPDRNVCAAGRTGQDDSIVDAGGALNVIEVWSETEGPRIVMVGVETSQAAAPGLPAAFTRLGPYLPWILDTLQP